MSTFLERLAAPGPALWLEVAPPRGINPASLLQRLAGASGDLDAINLADNALGRVKMSPLIFAAMLRARLDVSLVLNFSCRDRNRLALKADLLGAAALGVEGVVSLKGDRLAAEQAGARAVDDLDVFGLLEAIAALNRGEAADGRQPLKDRASLAAGVVANPYRKELEREFELLARKAAAGARFVITQPIFDAETGLRFVRRARDHGLLAVLGVLPIKRESMADYIKERIPDLSGARSYFDRFAGLSEAEVRRLSIDQSLQLMNALGGEAAAFNIMSAGGPSLAIELAAEFRRRARRSSSAATAG